ncbi:class I SAM-dependent methyltransferase [Helicobacter sp. 16-1353]|uniref:Eco57I restriction-modification methylase domain-containing protein n=1 Tax=Helicobacter sp. 16-1353 TaxID=2004996 RepID=UPI00215D3A4B|nr:class I SAM-dependent methyltransferase [Helicobacter sp. 16-1353]
MDFFDFSIDEKFDSIIGNPPYVRYRDISPSTKSAINGFLENLEPENYADLAEFANLVDSTNPANPTNFANITNPQNQASLNNPTNLKTHTIATNLTTQKNSQSLFDERTNLYIFFIFKCVLHLKSGGELVFITPRDFLKSTSSRKLNEFLFAQGSITDFIDLGDRRIFAHATPNCAIWRFEKGNFTRDTNLLIFQDFSTFIKNTICKFTFLNGQIIFSKSDYSIPFYELFFVKVGAVSGADSIFGSEEFGDVDFVCSKTIKSGKTKKMIYGKSAENSPYLRKFKEVLMQRRIKKFSENNWFEWGRDYFKSDLPRIYVNTKTRHKKPFFIHDCKAYDGSILAIFPKFRADLATLQRVCAKLNALDWAELGFVCDGRFIFSQRSLENCHLDSSFAEFLNIISIN